MSTEQTSMSAFHADLDERLRQLDEKVKDAASRGAPTPADVIPGYRAILRELQARAEERKQEMVSDEEKLRVHVQELKALLNSKTQALTVIVSVFLGGTVAVSAAFPSIEPTVFFGYVGALVIALLAVGIQRYRPIRKIRALLQESVSIQGDLDFARQEGNQVERELSKLMATLDELEEGEEE